MNSRTISTLQVLLLLVLAFERTALEAENRELPKLLSLSGHTDDVLSLAFLPESWILISASQDTTIRYWDTQTGELQRTVPAHSAAVRSLAVSPDGQTLASAGSDGLIKLWDAKSGAPLRTLDGTITKKKYQVVTASWSPDGKLLAVSDGRVKVWDAVTGKQRRIPVEKGSELPFGHYIAWTSNRKLATAVDEGSTIWLWDVDAGKQDQELTHRGHIHSMSIRPDRNVLVTGGHSRYLTFFDLAAGTKQVVRHGKPHYWLSWSPGGGTLAAGPILLDSAGSEIATIAAWEKKKSWPMWGSGPVVAWSPDSQVIATVREKNIELWDTSTVEPESTSE